jgi:hypothetical protein
MTKIVPTVGRVVWFTPSRLTGDYGFTHIDSRKPLAAIVAHVFNDCLVNLSVFDSNGTPFSRTSVQLCRRRGQAGTRLFLLLDALPGRAGREARGSATRLTNHAGSLTN